MKVVLKKYIFLYILKKFQLELIFNILSLVEIFKMYSENCLIILTLVFYYYLNIYTL